MKPKVLVVIGPSGVGKSTLFSRLRQEGVVRVVHTWTTRKSRYYEDPVNADHVFTDEAEFTAREQAGFFLTFIAVAQQFHKSSFGAWK